jgi:poly-gamma-glutamate synthesis protein (capsule biosynthesis protein)
MMLVALTWDGSVGRAAPRTLRLQMPAAWVAHLQPVLGALDTEAFAWQAVAEPQGDGADFGLIDGAAAVSGGCQFSLAIPAAVVAVDADLLQIPDLAALTTATGSVVISDELRDLGATILPADITAEVMPHADALQAVLADKEAIGLVRWQSGQQWPAGLRPLRIGSVFPGEAGAVTWSASVVPLKIVPKQEIERLCAALTRWATPPIQIAAVGDIMLGRSINTHVERTGEVDFPFAPMSALLNTADLRVGNLECVISELGEAAYKAYAFRVGYWGIESLARARFEVLSLGNNHALDFGPEAMLDTLARLRAAGITVVGAGANEADARAHRVVEVGGFRLAFLGVINTPNERYGFDPSTTAATATTPGVAWGDPDRLRADVQAAQRDADLVIVMLHSGTEWRIEPTTIQQALARAAIDAGAAAVIGAHPHVMQGAAYYGNGFIAYSLGNFVFEANDNGQAFLRLWIGADGVRAYAWEPYRVALSGRPLPANEIETGLILAGMNSMTKTLNER